MQPNEERADLLLEFIQVDPFQRPRFIYLSIRRRIGFLFRHSVQQCLQLICNILKTFEGALDRECMWLEHFGRRELNGSRREDGPN
jgi:hypothetical protein